MDAREAVLVEMDAESWHAGSLLVDVADRLRIFSKSMRHGVTVVFVDGPDRIETISKKDSS